MSTVVFDPNLYINGGQLAWGSNTTLTVSACHARSSDNTADILTSTSITLNAAINGVNGLDVGSLAASTVYYVFLISDRSGFAAPGVLLSLSPTAPLMPENYGLDRYIGRARTDGSSHFLKFYSSGTSSTRTILFDTPLAILAGGASTTFAAVDCLIGAGIGVVPIMVNYAYTPANAANTASIRPTGSAAAALSCAVELKGAAAVAYKEQFLIVPQLSSGVPKIDYLVTSSDALTLAVQSFVEYL